MLKYTLVSNNEALFPTTILIIMTVNYFLFAGIHKFIEELFSKDIKPKFMIFIYTYEDFGFSLLKALLLLIAIACFSLELDLLIAL